MNRHYSLLPCMTLAALSSLTLAAQQGNAAPTQAVPSAATIATSATANPPQAKFPLLRPVACELVTKIDAKKSKAGEPVVVKTTEEIITANGLVIPKDSKIMGHVVDVQPHSKQNPNSKITLLFDQAQLKSGQTLTITSVLQSVAPAAGAVSPGDVDPFGAGAPGATGMTSAGSPGGASPSRSPGMAPTLTTQTQGSTAAMMNNHSSNNGPKPGVVVATQGNVAIQTTSIPGLLIATNANGHPFSNASGALLGARQNVHLDGGTKVTLAICDSPARAAQ